MHNHQWVLTRDGGQPICEDCGRTLEDDVWFERVRERLSATISDFMPPVEKSAKTPPYGDNL